MAVIGVVAGCAQPEVGATERREHPATSITVATTTVATSEPSAAASTVPSAPPPAPTVPAGMARVPGGNFLMGSARAQGDPAERPMHERAVATFYLDLTEITVADYRRCVDANRCEPAGAGEMFCNERLQRKERARGDEVASQARERHPANCVRQTDAAAYCAFAGKRLPTETEWEYAASGGAEQRAYSWGNNPPTSAIACYDHSGGSCPVASFAVGAYGLFDMSGNVWEWTSSWYGSYPEVAAKGTHKVFKGGSWSRWQPRWLRNKNRSRWEPERSNAWLGFRCARSEEPVQCPDDFALRGEPPHCQRVRGTPLCEPGTVYNGRYCALGGPEGPPVTAEHGYRTADGKGPPGAPGPPDEPVSMQRTPEHDEGCRKLYLGRLNTAFLWQGNTFHKRADLVAAAGCLRRDLGARWTSGCCKP